MTLRICLAAAATLLLGTANGLYAQNLLTSGDFEPPGGGEIFGWDLDEFITGSSDAINAAQPINFNPDSGDAELWLRSFAGGSTPGPDNLTNAVLSQTVPATPGVNYTFTGKSRWEVNYSGAVTTLDAGSPLGAAPSPTDTNLVLEFLDSGGSVLDSQTLDLRPSHDEFNAGIWIDHSLSHTAPASTASVRVAAEARDMVFNTNPMQSAFFDTFTLEDGSATELLTNADLDTPTPSGLDAWTVENVDPENPTNDEIIRTAGFANRPESGGSEGIWLSSFFGSVDQPVDGLLSQTIEAAEGNQYTFSGWSRWETNFSGGVDTIDAANENGDGGKASPTEVFLELAFLDGSGTVIDTPLTLDVRDDREAQSGGTANDAAWYEHELTGAAPTGTASVRVLAAMLDGVNNVNPNQSAFWDDFALVAGPGGGLVADLDADNDVDGNDFLLVQRTDPSLTPTWESEFGQSNAARAAGNVPEPTTALLTLLAAATFAARRRTTAL